MTEEKDQKELKKVLRRSILEEDKLLKGILFSGGLDTSIIAHILASKGYEPKLVTVGLEGFPATDLKYSGVVARKLGLRHLPYVFGREEFFDYIGRTVEILETFDHIEIRNSAAILIALDRAKMEGIQGVYTGDGADEVFGGYSFLFEMDREKQKKKIKQLSTGMKFSAKKLCRNGGMKLSQPFTNPNVVDFARKLKIEQLINKEGRRKVGKWILRQAYEDDLPREIVWRKKTPIESGSGTKGLTEIVGTEIEDDEFEDARRSIQEKDGVELRNKEQLFCYRIYRDKFGPPRAGQSERPTCNRCGSPLSEEGDFCRTCGTYFGNVSPNDSSGQAYP